VKFLSLIMLSVCVSGDFAQSNSSFYVSNTGDDSNPGTQRAPWPTIQHPADTARAGSTVNVRGGIYEERVRIKESGNATGGYITFRSCPGETAVLDAESLLPTAGRDTDCASGSKASTWGASSGPVTGFDN
jgi:hypothetical protein